MSTETRAGFLILGATGSVGSEVSHQLVRAGHNVFVGGRSTERLAKLQHELDCPGGEFEATDFDSVTEITKAASEALKGLSGVVNCVGSILLKPAHLTSPDEWQAILQTNLTSAFATVSAAGRAMAARGGSVVLVSSAAARLGLSNHEAIAAAKAGIVGLILSAAATYAPRGIRFNAVAPGLVESNLTADLLSNENTRNASTALHPLKRIGQPKDVAKAITWLLDPDQAWVTGQVLGVDGGLGSVRART